MSAEDQDLAIGVAVVLWSVLVAFTMALAGSVQ